MIEIKVNDKIVDSGDDLYISTNIFRNNSEITDVDLLGYKWTNFSASQAFANCSNLTSVTNIADSIDDIGGMFYNCSSLTSTMPIPNSVTNMYCAFSGCYNLVNAPEIPNSVINMCATFQSCYNLVNAPVISNSVINMSSTFASCYNLVNAPEIPNGVTNMSSAFSYCRNLTGNIYIYSNNITNAYRCFQGTSLSKNVYIPFKYQNGVNTKTYNAFKQYYGSSQNGVTLRNISTI